MSGFLFPPSYPSNYGEYQGHDCRGWCSIGLSLAFWREALSAIAVCRLAKSMANSSSSAITLTKNSQFYVRQGDVERLIQQGYLQRLT